MQKTIPIIVMATLCLIFKVNAQTIIKLRAKVIPFLNMFFQFIKTNKKVIMINQKINILLLQLFIMLICIIPIKAQVASPQTQKILMVGRQMPDLEIKEMVNYRSSSARISDFKGKLLILDFWATWCGPCVSMFPKTDSLEKLFNGNVQFLGVTNEPKHKVNDFFSRMYNFRKIMPRSVVNDSVLSRLFYYSNIPYYVWIDGTGKIIATTGSVEITAENIQAAIDGKPASFANRNDVRLRLLDDKKPVFVLGNRHVLKDTLARREEVPKQNILSYSVATKSMDATPGVAIFDGIRFSAVNISVDFLYRYYYNLAYYDKPIRGAFNSKNRHEFKISDSLRLSRITIPPTANIKGGTIGMSEYVRDNAVCYEIVYPLGLTWKQKMELMKKDLDRYFAKPIGFKTHVEKRTDSNANVLRRIDDKIELVTKGGKSEEKHDRFFYIQQNMPLSHFIGLLRAYFFQKRSVTFADKTAFYKPVDLELTCDMQNIESINKALAKYGLRFDTELDETDVLVFSDAKD